MSFSWLPTLNAFLNSGSALLLLAGYYFIRQKQIKAHQTFMLLAFGCSTLFLISYLTYHARVGSVRFQGTGGLRTLYFTILLTHSILAAVIVPMALTTLHRAWKARFDKHRQLARWTLPVWLYVSVSGVAVYWMLYHL